jgi:hypothetical protein
MKKTIKKTSLKLPIFLILLPITLFLIAFSIRLILPFFFEHYYKSKEFENNYWKEYSNCEKKYKPESGYNINTMPESQYNCGPLIARVFEPQLHAQIINISYIIFGISFLLLLPSEITGINTLIKRLKQSK